MLMDPLVRYYLHQVVCGKHDGIGPIYAAPPFLPRGYRIGSSFSMVMVTGRPILWSGAKTLGRETLRTGGDNLTYITRSAEEDPRHIVLRRLHETAQNLTGKLRARGRKRKAGVVKRIKNQAGKKPRVTKRDNFS